MTFVDLHCHILPGLDDGAADEGDFFAMARVALGGGTGIMVATPTGIWRRDPHRGSLSLP